MRKLQTAFTQSARSCGALLLLATTFLSAGLRADSRAAIGLVAPHAQLFLEPSLESHVPAFADRFGASLATGDFNADGADDLAIGIPGEDCAADVADCGSVAIRFGIVGCGFSCTLPLFLDPWDAGAPDTARAAERYGAALAVGDFDCDGYDDLAVGVPGNVTSPYGVTGSVQIHRGLHGSLGSIEWVASHQLAPGFGGFPLPESGHDFGSLGTALAVGDFNRDGCDDLAIGDPTYGRPGASFSGRVYIAHGHPYDGESAGLFPYYGFHIEESYYSVPGVISGGDRFGSALATGDFNCDAVDDLAIGVPGEDSFFGIDAGTSVMVYGAAVHSLILTEGDGVPAPHAISDYGLHGNSEPADAFGSVLASGDFNDDGCADLAYGTPAEDLAGTGEGYVAIAYGEPTGLSTLAPSRFGENDLFGAGASESLDAFGSALVVGDFDRDGIDDLAIGAPGEDEFLSGATLFDAGAVTVVLGRSNQRMPGIARRLFPFRAPSGVGHAGMIPDSASDSPAYGAALAAGDFDGNDQADLAIGATGRDFSGMSSAGAVSVLYAQLFFDGFEAADAFEWSDVAP